MVEIVRRTRILEGFSAQALPFDALMEEGAPTILKGAAAHWPLAQHGRDSAEAAMAYLLRFYNGKQVVCYCGPPDIKGRFSYNEALSGFNFTHERTTLDALFERIAAGADRTDAPSLYVGSTDVDIYLPGLRAENDLSLTHPMFYAAKPLIGIWLGNRTTACAHYDMSHNIAVCMVGRRRFTLFPPDQIANLYPGPLEPTPGGQVVSIVDFTAPDFDRFPRFADALATAEIAELEPGDVLFYPALWWHQVEALGAFNAMINYWWDTAPSFLDLPQLTLLHGLLSLRDRSESEKRAWRALFDYYVFGPSERAGAHLPEHARGALGRLDDIKARRLRAQILNRLNR